MAVAHVTSFTSYQYPGVGPGSDPRQMFEWDDAGDNSALETWAEGRYPGQFSVTIDTSGPTDVFQWEQTANGSATGSFDLEPGMLVWVWKFPGLLGEPTRVTTFDGLPVGSWFSDEYGRPLDLNDLQAP